MSLNILFLGMNRISASLGLVMKISDKNLNRIGFDSDILNVRMAIEDGALDHSIELLAAGGVKESDVIIYSLPVGIMPEILNSIRQDIKSGCFFVCLTPIGHDTFDQVTKLLPDPNSFIAWYPAINPKYVMDHDFGVRGARPDLFNNSQIYIAGNVNTHPEALKLGNDLAILAGSQPINIEPEELAGILALGNDFPLLVSAATTRLVTSEPGWNEARKLAGFNFDHLSALLESPDNQATPDCRVYANRRNLQRLLGLLIEHLSQIYQALESESPEVGLIVQNAALARQVWQKQRSTMSWFDLGEVKPKAPPSLTEKLLGKRRK